MTCIVKRVVLSSGLAVFLFAAAASPAAADPIRGRFGGCIQACNQFHQACHERTFMNCGAAFPPGSAEYGACAGEMQHICNLLAFDCRYNFCLSGDPEPVSPAVRGRQEPHLP